LSALADSFFIFTIDLLAFFALYLIVTTSLNLELGYTGVPNLGKMLAVAGGAFVAGYFPGRFAAWLFGVTPTLDYVNNNSQVLNLVSIGLQADVPLAIGLFASTLILAVLVGAILGYIASFPAIRLREDYLAITLLAMAEGLRVVGNNYVPIVGGPLGVGVADVFGWIPVNRFTFLTFLMLGLAGLVLLYAEFVARSPLGRSLRAIRDNEVAAEALGKDIVRMRMRVLVVGSGMAAIAGAMYSFYTGAVIANSFDRTTWTFVPLVMVILGGSANNTGITVGTFTYVTVRKLIAFYKTALVAFIPFNAVWLDPMLLGVVLIVMLIFRAQGLVPEKPTFTLSREKLRAIILQKS
jgi:branched-chain amino acid transport system permease protein